MVCCQSWRSLIFINWVALELTGCQTVHSWRKKGVPALSSALVAAGNFLGYCVYGKEPAVMTG